MINDEVYSLTDLTLIDVTGKRENVEFVTSDINQQLDDIEVKSVTISFIESRSIMKRVSHLKSAVDPAEI